MNVRDVTLAELEKLAGGIEEGGVTGLTVPDLAFIAKTTELIAKQAGRINMACQQEAITRLNAREGDLIAERGSTIKRSPGKPTYNPDVPTMVAAILPLDASAVQKLFEKTEEQTFVVPSEWKVRNTTALKNWIAKLGTSDVRVTLEQALRKTEGRPTIDFQAVDPETGEVLS